MDKLEQGGRYSAMIKILRSSDEPTLRRYIVNEAIPTAVGVVADVPEGAGVGFAGLPCLGCRGVLGGLYSMMDDALRAKDKEKVKKL